MAEALLRSRLNQAGIEAQVSSAGILYDGKPASEGAVEAMRRRGIDLTHHRSRLLTAEMLESADLVLAMARMHAREAIVLDRSAFGRIFTLREFVRLGDQLGPSGVDDFDGWLARVGADRRPAALLGEDPADDVVDPIGRPLKFYEATGAELAALVEHVTRLVPALRPAADGAALPLGQQQAPPRGTSPS